MRSIRPLTATPLVALAAVILAGCASPTTEAEPAAEAEATTVTVEDNHGEQTVTTPPKRVVATDNRTIAMLDSWGVEVVGAPLDIFPAGLSFKDDPNVANLGNHREPDLEAVVAADPDLIVNGQRFSTYYGDFQTLVPDATIVELDPRDGEPLDAELKRQVTALGEIFGKQDEAATLVADFDAAIDRVKAAYDTSETAMGLITSGGEINYAAPTTGRTLGPVYDILGLTPALDSEGSTDHQGDDISVEAVASSNPDWILVMDRDAAVSVNTDEAYTPANDLISNSEALKNVTAVTEGNVVYMPQGTYLNEGIETYTQFFNDLADALEGR
ncbi:iron complex transport system substrate-binding protein [Microbacterium sp. SORGH_AS 505]|uniref:siderophore ABC transporter substrate-binding protein n=1 Tax=Microbacterium sp. SORGH_AS_0505 TaxID=3041770 RepID=UPI002781DCCD|nr:ABC transporter substrate-binding protein [Microbacterium sp. SORGH_AS_0505]MDQ1126820.1 iron complex transport system substrate-binding protein [Microbacterium sp. SORGH_AS_0505]